MRYTLEYAAGRHNPLAVGGLQQKRPGELTSHGTVATSTHSTRPSVSGCKSDRRYGVAGAQSIDEVHSSETCATPRLKGSDGTHTERLPQSRSFSSSERSHPLVHSKSSSSPRDVGSSSHDDIRHSPGRRLAICCSRGVIVSQRADAPVAGEAAQSHCGARITSEQMQRWPRGVLPGLRSCSTSN